MVSHRTSHPDRYVVRLCREALKQQRVNLHIFVNSVRFIADVIHTLSLSPDDVKVVCSQSGSSRQANQKLLGEQYPIAEAGDKVKRINFYTSTCFEGCDIYDHNGLTYIVSDGRRANTLLDISTLFTQICGRVRNSRYSDRVVHIYSTTHYSEDVSLEEFKLSSLKTFEEARKYADELNALSESARRRTLQKIPYLNERYIKVEDDRLIADRNLVNKDIVNFKICRHIYRHYANLKDELQSSGYKVQSRPYCNLTERLESKPTARVSFKDLFEEYAQLKTAEPIFSFSSSDEQCAIIARTRPLVKEAYDSLGIERVRELNYHTGNIQRELTRQMAATTDYKIVRMIHESLPRHKAIPKAKVKEVLQSVYDTLGSNQRAKATDLQR